MPKSPAVFSTSHKSLIRPEVTYIIGSKTHGKRTELATALIANGYFTEMEKLEDDIAHLIKSAKERIKAEKEGRDVTDSSIIRIGNDGEELDKPLDERSLKLSEFTASEYSKWVMYSMQRDTILHNKYRVQYLRTYLLRIDGYTVLGEGKPVRITKADQLFEMGEIEMFDEALTFLGHIGLTEEEKQNLGLPTSGEQGEVGPTPNTTAPNAEGQE